MMPMDTINERSSHSSENERKSSKKSPFSQLHDAIRVLYASIGDWNEDLQRDLPTKWEKHGDMVLLPERSFQRPEWRLLGRNLWKVVCESLHCKKLARKRRVFDDDFRRPHIDLLYGENSWVEHVDNGIRYSYDVTKCMFSIGNIGEKLRIASFDCRGETVVDMFSGIGYFTLPYLIHAKANHLYACEWNSDAVEALKKNLLANKVDDRCTVLEGDCRKVCPSGVADRVNLGLLPTASQYWLAACKALKPLGGVLHIHENLTLSKLHKTGSVDQQTDFSAKKSMPPTKKLDKFHSMDSNGAAQNGENNVAEDTNGNCNNKPVRRKMSQTIEEEMDTLNHLLYTPAVESAFEEEWAKLDRSYREFALMAGQKVFKYLNNLHVEQNMSVSICRIGRIKSYAPQIDHVVLDLKCSPMIENCTNVSD